MTNVVWNYYDLLYLYFYGGGLSPNNNDGPNGNGAVGTLVFK